MLVPLARSETFEGTPTRGPTYEGTSTLLALWQKANMPFRKFEPKWRMEQTKGKPSTIENLKGLI